MEEGRVDVVVVGAGIAGLTTARYIQQRDPLIKIKVLEAKSRVGGRTQTMTMKTASGTDQWDVGGQWIGSTQKHALDLLNELNIGLYEQYTSGTKCSQLGSTKIRTYDSVLPNNSSVLLYSLPEIVDFLRVFSKFESLASKVPSTNPFASKELAALDNISVAEFTNRFSFSKTMEDSSDCIARASFGTRSHRMSMLYFLMYAHAGGKLSDLLEAVDTGAQRYRIKGGSQQLSKMMSADLGEDVVVFNRALWKIEQDDAGVTVFYINTEQSDAQIEKLRCKRVILAIPPQQVAGVLFDPPLPEMKHQLFRAFPMGNLLKFIITYKTAFWREKGFSGEIAASGLTEVPGKVTPINITYDATTHHGNPALVGFFNSEWSSRPVEERKTAVLRDLARYFGAEAMHYVDYVDKDWAVEPYSGGCPVGILPPGYMEHYSHIREPDKKVHYAGTETATQWPGYISGAIQSGRRAGAEVLKELKPGLEIPESDLEGSVYAKNYVPPDPRKDLAYENRSTSYRNLALVASLCLAGYLAARKAGWIEGDKIDLKFVKL